MSTERAVPDALERVLKGSSVVGAARRVVRTANLAAMGDVVSRIAGRWKGRVRRGSRTWTAFDHVRSSVNGPLADATVVGLAATLARFTRASFLYRWLTAEPEPAVIVIDLRDTVTVGPVVAAVDTSFRYVESWLPSSAVARWAGETIAAVRERPLRATSVTVFAAATASLLANAATGSVDTGVFLGHAIVLGIAALGYRDTRSWAEVRETRPARLLVALLEPPEPPGDGSWDERTSTERDDSEE